MILRAEVIAFFLTGATLGSIRSCDAVALVQTRHDAAEYVTPPGDSAEEPGAERQLMVNSGDIEYISYMKIGNQTVTGILDTGSFELVVFSAQCETCGIAAKYDPTLSSHHSYGPLKTIQSYGSGDTQSSEAFDMVGMGPFKPRRQSFWEVTNAHMPILKEAAFQAIVGVGPPETAASDAWKDVQKTLTKINNKFENSELPGDDAIQKMQDLSDTALELTKANVMLSNFQVRTFSVCMGAEPGSNGYFVWNDRSHENNPDLFTTLPVVGKHTWSMVLENVRLLMPGGFQDTKLGCSKSTCTALVDTGTSLVAVPYEVVSLVKAIVDRVGGGCQNMASMPSLIFEMGGRLLSLPPDAYLAEVKEGSDVPSYLEGVVRPRMIGSSGPCRVLLMESYMTAKTGPMWIFGMPFFRKYYTTFSVGAGQSTRALHVAEANDECMPAKGTSLARARPQRRRIDVAKVHLPPLLRKDNRTIVDI